MPLDITIPSPGESVTEVTISAWLKRDGDFVRRNEELFEIESDKATLGVSAEADGKLRIVIPQGQTVRVGAVAAQLDTSVVPDSTGTAPPAPAPLIAAPPVPPATKPSVTAESYAEGVPSPAARKILEERGLSPADVNGSGRGGRVTKADALDAPSKPLTAAPLVAAATPPVPRAQTRAGERGERRQPMSKLRQTVSARLVAAKNTTAMLTTFNEIDMSRCLAVRKEYKDRFKEQYGIGLGFMSFFSRAAIAALQQYPAVNAFIDGDEFVFHDYIDLGIAVQAPKGLVVPVVRNAETLSFEDIEREIDRLAARARTNQLTVDEMTGGTFTISNGGVFGNLMSTPILNPPQSGILGMHNIVDRPIALNGEVVIRPMMYVALSYDHRVIDGRESVGFLKRIKELIEDPIRLLLNI
ncbi:2-oxoglutarate dehydrogenase complex dihydrolipoyllysine-residue succinyltransferase [candidate division KSB1 bacterium]|nr:2-oxoglutarate dehydrogenase complex dihydrolipoyllysine-residue succinyltransferase [candidate division KSB1 bacterium]